MRADRGRPGEPTRPPGPGPAPRRRHPPAARDCRHHAAAGNTKSYNTITKCQPDAADPSQVRRRG